MTDRKELFLNFKKYHEKEDLAEEVIKLFYSSFLSPVESISIDCGCHKGFHTELLSQFSLRVVAVDANADLCDYMRTFVVDHKITNCDIVFSAIQDDPNADSVTFFVSDNYLGRSSLTRLWDAIDADVTYRPVVCPATTIDRLNASLTLDRVDFIKLDLEGGEYRALLGGRDVLSRHMPVVVFENSIHAAQQGSFSSSDLYDYLTDFGYIIVTPSGDVVSRDSLFPFWYLFALPKKRFIPLVNKLNDAYLRVCSDRGLA
jgi:FkbM family methyltransferase